MQYLSGVYVLNKKKRIRNLVSAYFYLLFCFDFYLDKYYDICYNGENKNSERVHKMFIHSICWKKNMKKQGEASKKQSRLCCCAYFL